MKIKPYIEKLNNSSEYKDFLKKYKDSFLVAGFFILDLESGKNVHQVDYYVPSEKKIAAFTLDGGVSMQLLETMNSKVPEALDMKTNIDLDALQGILMDEMKNRSITEDIRKIIAILQNIEGKKIWNLSCVLSGMQILRAHIEDSSKSVLKMETSSMMDLVKKINPQDLMKMKGAQAPAASPAAPSTIKDDVKSKLDQLNKLSAAIEQEKKTLQAQMKSAEDKPAKSAAKAKKVKAKK